MIDAEKAAESSEPFRSVAQVMLEVTGGDPIPREKVERYLPKTSPVRKMIAQHGLDTTRRLVRWVTEHKPKAMKTIADSSEMFLAEAKAAGWGPPGAKREPKKSPNDRRRMLDEALGLGNG